jgi:uncharacterized membrane protein
MNIKAWFHPQPPPRVMLIFPAILIMLLAMLAGALALSYNNDAMAVVGIVLGLLWMGLLVLVALPQTDRWFKRAERWFKPLAATLMVVLVFAGAVELLALMATGLGTTGGGVLGDSTPKFLAYISHDLSSSDAVALLDQAVTNVRDGKNPYANANVVTAVVDIQSPFDKTTPLHTGSFSSYFPYPPTAAINELWAKAVQTPESIPPELESKLGYPAGFFLIPALFSFLGINNIRVVSLLLVLTGMGITIALTPSRMRIWLAGACLGSLVIWNGIASGMTGSLYFPFLLLAWVLWKKNMWLSALCMGIAVATKQVAWFFLPFYLILVLRHLSWKKALLVAGVGGGVFAAFNLPFIVASPSLWLDSVTSMMKDALFPSGWGFITLVLQGWVHIESPLLFTVLEITVFLASVAWYWRYARAYPCLGVILPILPLFFAWRSLWPYFFYVDIIVLAVVMQEYISTRGSSVPAAAEAPVLN